MTTIANTYDITTVGELVALWTNNPTFKKQIGPTVGHLKEWLIDNKTKFTYTHDYKTFKNGGKKVNTIRIIKDNIKTYLTFDPTNDVEVFLCLGKSYLLREHCQKYAYEYITSKYGNNVTYKDINKNPIYYFDIRQLCKYIIANNIKLDNWTKVSNRLSTGQLSVDELYKLHELGFPYENNQKFINYFDDHAKIYDHIASGCKYFVLNFYDALRYRAQYYSSVEVAYELLTKYKDCDYFWTFETNDTEVNKICKRIVSNKQNIHNMIDMVSYWYIVDGKIQYNEEYPLLYHVGTFINYMIDVIKKLNLDINIPVSNTSYLIQFVFQRLLNFSSGSVDYKTCVSYITQLLDMGCELFDKDGFLLKGATGKDIVAFMGTYKPSYDILTEYYKNNYVMLQTVNNAYAKYIPKPTVSTKPTEPTVAPNASPVKYEKASCLSIVLHEDIFEDKPELAKLYNSIDNKKIKDKLTAYRIKQLLKTQKK